MAELLDENGDPLLDEDGQQLYDEGGPAGPDPSPVFTPPPPPWLLVGVGPSSGDAPTQPLTAFTTVTIKDSLTAGPEISFSLSGKSPAALVTDGLATDVWAYRKQVKWRRCRTLPIEQAWGPSGEDEVSVISVGYRRLVEWRHLISALSFTGVDQGTIVWNLVQHTQAQTGGDLGIVLGDVLTGQLRDRTEWKAGDQLGGLINSLGDVINGVWWGIDANKVLDVRLWSDFPVRGDAIVLGQNASAMKRTRAVFGNAVGVSGDSSTTVPAWRVDPNIGLDPRGRWEVFDSSHSSVKLQATVNDYADELLVQSLTPPSGWAVTLDVEAYFDGGSMYEVGEIVPIVVPASAVDEIGAPPVNVMAQVTEVVIAFDESAGTSVTLAALEVS